jgi:hypothetical protein
VYSDGQKELLDYSVEQPEDYSESQKSNLGRVTASPKKAQQIVEGLSHKYNSFEIKDIVGTTYSEPLQSLEPEQFGGPAQYRGIAKMAFNFLAIAPGSPSGFANWKCFDGIRHFIRYGQEFVQFPAIPDTRNLLALSVPSGDVFCNRIAIWCNPESRNAVAIVEVLSALTYSVLLSRDYAGPPVGALICNYPHECGPDEMIQVSGFPQVETEVILDRGADDEWLRDSQTSMNALLSRVRSFDERRYTEAAIREAFEKFAPSGITSENIGSVARFLAEKLLEGHLPNDHPVTRRYSSWEKLQGRLRGNSKEDI